MTFAAALAALLPIAFGPAPLPVASPLPQRGRGNPGAQPQGAQDAAAAQAPAPARAASPAAGSAQGGTPKVQEVGDYIVITVDETGTDSINLEWLTKVCELYTGIVFTYDDTTSQQLQNAKVRLIGTKRVPKAEIYSFYQILMFIHGFILTRVGPEPLSIVLVQPVQPTPGKANNVRNESVYLTPEELEQYSSQVATQVVTVLHLPHTDVRQLGNSLRGLTTDPTGQQNVVPVGNTNSVILTGFASSVASLARILKLVDAESARDADVSPVFEVIPLEWAAAEDMADILEQLLEAARRNVQGARQQIQAQGATGQIAGQGGETKILTYPRTNSLLVMALPDDMRNIRELVARLDVDVPEPERTYHVYALENVAAADLADVLEEFIQGANRIAGAGAGARGGGGGNAQPGSPGTGLSSRDSEIVVVADETTNSLLVAASKRRYEEVAELIEKLDQRQDQVLIETALIELTGRTGLDLGVELGLADIPGDGTGGFGISSFGLSEFADTNGDGAPDQRIPNDSLLGLTGGIIDAGDFSLPVLVNALATRRDTNVLSRPSLLVNNNGSATVESLDSNPTQNVTQAAAGGSQAGFGGYEDAGVTLTISPSISASGYLRLNVSLVISTFTGSSSNPNVPPPKTTRTITTTINVPDGDTMVIGGIITEADTKDNSRVPWLGDIPLLGRLFRRDSDSSTKTTLYFFVTPHILEDENFADLAEISYRAKLDAAETIGAGRVKQIDPSFMRSGDQVDLAPFELPLYRSPRTGNVSAGEVGLDPDATNEMIEQASEAKSQKP